MALPSFHDLDLGQPLLRALDQVGYEQPTPIQAQTIPPLLAGRDLLGQAQTGTGKTAAFALPLLSRLDLSDRAPQILVLTPTRELALQVSEAFQRYAAYLKNFHILPVYGGQGYSVQLRPLRRGVHVVVGTPGRLMDHMRRGSLCLDQLRSLVLDEADEMLRMGFLEDVTWILEQAPKSIQRALFSATMPEPIRKIAQKYLSDPVEIRIQVRSAPADTIRQRYWVVGRQRKLEALTRLLEVEEFDGMLVFVRTKTATTELSEKLEARGFASAPLNGDIAQSQRERTVERLKKGRIDVIVATDVAARGLDVERVSHVVNYDAPYDTESYVHRIGRTGRAGRPGEAILFLAPRERRMLKTIEKAIRRTLEPLRFPSTQEINARRVLRFKERVKETLAVDDLGLFGDIASQLVEETHTPLERVAAALAKMAQGSDPLILPERNAQGDDLSSGSFGAFSDGPNSDKHPRKKLKRDRVTLQMASEPGMERFRVEVGHQHEVKPGQIVATVARVAGIRGEHIGRIDIYNHFTTLDLPVGMPKEVFEALQTVRVRSQALRLSKVKAASSSSGKKKGKGSKKNKAEIGNKKKPNNKHKPKLSKSKKAKKE